MKKRTGFKVNDATRNANKEKRVDYMVDKDNTLVFLINESLREAVLVGLKSVEGTNNRVIDMVIPSVVEGCVVNSIGPHAFLNHKNIKSIIIPESIIIIEDGAFKWCSNLIDIVIPESVTRIGAKAFWGCFNLSNIAIPNTIVEIGDYALNGCKKLKKINIPKKLNRIGHGLFSHCSSLKKIVIPNSVVEIGNGAFYACESLNSIVIPRSVKTLGQKVFCGCTKLKQLVIPDSVLEMGDCILDDCENLGSLVLPNNVVIKRSMMLKNCKKIESVILPKSIFRIADNAFAGCTSLKELSIPQSVVEIGHRAFMYCANLKTIQLPCNLVSIGQRAFWDCLGISEICVPDSVTEIGDYAFFGCSELKKIKISESVLTISPGTFFGCSKLSEIIVPNSVKAIGKSAFEGCVCLKTLKLPDELEDLGDLVFKDCKSLDSLSIPCGVTRIPDELFYHCFQLRECNIPESVIEIGDGAFTCCKNLNYIRIPDSVTHIGSRAFFDCSNLMEITIPRFVTEIREGTFRGCFSLYKVSFPESLIKIEDEAFMNCSNIIDVVFPNTVNSIGQNAFWGCSRIKRIVIPSSVTEIGNRVFANCKRLVSIVVSQENPIYDSRNGCNAVVRSNSSTLVQGCNHTVLDKTIETIGQYAFHGCNRISSIVIPDSVSVIEAEAFSNCHNLNEVFIPDSVVKIGKDVFKGCDSLSKVFISKRSTLNQENLPKNVEVVSLDDYLQNKFEERLENDTNDCVSEEGKSELVGFTVEQFLNSNKKELDRLMVSDTIVAAEKINMYAFFDSLLFEIKNNVEFNNPEKTLRNVFFEVMNQYDWYPLKFVKYINVFNLIDAKQAGSLGFYADFIHSVSGKRKLSNGKELITDNRDKVDWGEGNQLIDGKLSPLEQLFQASGMFYREFEYCHTFNMPIYSQGLYAIKSDRSDSKGNSYIFDGLLAELISNDDSWQDNTLQLERWIDCFNTCYDKFDNDVSNSFYFIGSPWKNEKGYKEISDYVVRAYIGIDNKKGDREQIRLFLQEFQNFLEQVTFDIIVKLKNQQILQTAENGSITQAMIRNVSHNWSHVTNNYTSDNAYERFHDECIKQNLNSYSSLYGESQVFQNGKNFQLPFFIQYQNNRQNYLSEITFEAPAILTTKWFYGDVIKEFDRERVLLNHISGVSGFRYGFSLKYNGAEMNDANDLAVALPDVLGNQAVFNILENIIRNTAKHSSHGSDNVTITLEFKESHLFPGYYCLEIDNGVIEKDIEKLVRAQNTILNESVLDENYKLRNHGLGLLEMTVAAAFLRQIKISKINSFEYRFEFDDNIFNKQKKLILLQAINKSGALGYRLFLQKPKELLLVGEWNVEEDRKNELANCGICIIGADAFVDDVKKGNSFEHPFLLYQDVVCGNVKEVLSDDSECKTLLPVRKMGLGDKDARYVMDIIQKTEINEIVNKMKVSIWSRYYENVISKDLKNPDNGQLKIVTVMRTGAEKNSGLVSNQVVFLDHGYADTHNQCWSMAKESDAFEAWIENLSSKASSKLPNFAAYSIGEKKQMKNYIDHIMGEDPKRTAYEIFEAYHNKVLVLDERIQKFSKENYEGSSNEDSGPIPCSALFESTNVHIPDTPLDPNVFDAEAVERIEQFINDNLTNAFVLIHYGVLERMYKKESLITEKLNTWAKYSKRIVVTSGRGSHSLPLPHSVCFANLSSVLYAFAENRNKYLINNMFNQSRRKNG